MRQKVPLRVEKLESRTLYIAGELDTTFSADGKQTIELAGGYVFNSVDVALQSSGKSIVVGNVVPGGTPAAARLNADGSIDTTFGPDGTGVSKLAAFNVQASIHAVAVQSFDDKIVLVGTIPKVTSDGFVARLNADGSVDPSFAKGGYIDLFDTDDGLLGAAINDVAIQSNGKIVVAGESDAIDYDTNFAAFRFNTDGSPDNTFDGNGNVTIGLGAYDSATALTIDYSGTASTNSNYGKIILVGDVRPKSNYNLSQFGVVRLTAGGSLDNSFSDDGKLVMPFGSSFAVSSAAGVAVQSTGKIAVSGTVGGTNSSFDRLGVLRLNADGSSDPTFGPSNGQTQIAYGSTLTGGTLIIGQAGKLIVGGRADNAMSISCLSADGILDTNFGTAGQTTIAFQNSTGQPAYTGAYGLALAAGGTIVVTGGTYGATARIFDRRAQSVSIGTFAPDMYEQGPTSTSFVVTRLENSSAPLRVYLNIGGSANRPGNLRRLPVDYTGSNISFGAQFLGDVPYVDIPANETYALVTITPVDDTAVEGDETASFSVYRTDAYDALTPTSTTLVIHDNDITAGPSARSSAFVYDSGPPQRVTYTFDQDVRSSIGANDFTITGPAGAVPFTFAYDNVNDTATLSFTSILANGNYTATALAAGITNTAGTHMAANATLAFFFLNGDINHDRHVDVADLGILATNWQASGKTFSQGDLNYDGKVDVADLGILATNWQQSLAAPAPAPNAFNDVSTPDKNARNRRSDLIDHLLD